MTAGPAAALSLSDVSKSFEGLSAGADGSGIASAVLAGREVPIVDGLLQELVGLVLPEL